MGCFASKDRDLEKEAAHGVTPNHKRGCTDILFVLLFIASIAGIAVLLGKAKAAGADTDRVVRGVDYLGRICGKDWEVADKPFAAWSYIPTTYEQDAVAHDITSELYHIKVCVDSCDETTSLNANNGLTTTYNSTRYLYYCVPTWASVSHNSSVNVQVSFTGEFQSVSSVAAQNFVALAEVWPVILVSAFVAIAVSYLYIFSSRLLAGVFVWFAITLLAGGGFMISYALLKDATYTETNGTGLNDRAKILRGIGITFAVVTAIFVFIVFALRNRIRIAIEVVKEASRSISDVMLLPFFPVLPFVLTCSYFVLWIYTTIYIFSVQQVEYEPIPQIKNPNSGETLQFALSNYAGATAGNTTSTFYQQTSFNTNYQRSFVFVLFQLLWAIQFSEYFAFLVISCVISQWYFTRRDPQSGDKERGNGEYQLPYFPILNAIYRVVRYHLGTIAFAALIIAIIQTIRAVVKYIERQTYNSQGGSNRIQRIVFGCISCCLYCLQCCFDKINKNALVWTALYGDNLLVGSFSSFKLIWQNLFRCAALNAVSVYLMTLGKFIVALIVTGGCGLYMYNHYTEDNLSSIVLPILIIFFLSYVVAALFISTFETTADTIFLCFLVDEQYNAQNGQMLASPGLLEIVQKHRNENQKEAEQQIQQHQKRDERLGTFSQQPYGVQPSPSAGFDNTTPANHYAPQVSPPPNAALLQHQYMPGNNMTTAPSKY